MLEYKKIEGSKRDGGSKEVTGMIGWEGADQAMVPPNVRNTSPNNGIPGLKHADNCAFSKQAYDLSASSAPVVADAFEHLTTPGAPRNTPKWTASVDILVRYQAYCYLVGELANDVITASRARKAVHEAAYQAALDAYTEDQFSFMRPPQSSFKTACLSLFRSR